MHCWWVLSSIHNLKSLPTCLLGCKFLVSFLSMAGVLTKTKSKMSLYGRNTYVLVLLGSPEAEQLFCFCREPEILVVFSGSFCTTSLTFFSRRRRVISDLWYTGTELLGFLWACFLLLVSDYGELGKPGTPSIYVSLFFDRFYQIL